MQSGWYLRPYLYTSQTLFILPHPQKYVLRPIVHLSLLETLGMKRINRTQVHLQEDHSLSGQMGIEKIHTNTIQ